MKDDDPSPVVKIQSITLLLAHLRLPAIFNTFFFLVFLSWMAVHSSKRPTNQHVGQGLLSNPKRLLQKLALLLSVKHQILSDIGDEVFSQFSKKIRLLNLHLSEFLGFHFWHCGCREREKDGKDVLPLLISLNS